MSEININAVDLNLLRVFDALLEEGNVTRAGARLGLTQSAVRKMPAKRQNPRDRILRVMKMFWLSSEGATRRSEHSNSNQTSSFGSPDFGAR